MSELFAYKSPLASFMNDFIELKNASGINVLRTKWILLEIDKFYISQDIKDAIVTSPLVAKWRKTRINDSDSTIYTKYSVWNQLTRFMCRQGHECYIPPLPQYSSSRKGFTPYIFTHTQIKAIMDKTDELRLYDRHMTCAMMFIPAIIRLLYSAGPRVSEALSIKNEDVNFDESYIIIRKSKNGCERIIPLDVSMISILKQYMFYRDKMPVKDVAAPTSCLFVKTDGTPSSAGTVYTWFKWVLKECGIPHIGNHKGPRVHDLRHTFAVHALEQMARNGMDLYTSMPILSTCLGHKSLSATEQYVRLTEGMYPELAEQTAPINMFVYPKLRNGMLYED